MPPDPFLNTQSWLIFTWIIATFTFLVGMLWGSSVGYRRGWQACAKAWEARAMRRYRYEAQDIVSDPYTEDGTA